MDYPFGIWCEVWGGRTGNRTSWLKDMGRIVSFKTYESARAYADELQRTNNGNPNRTAEFRYTVRTLDKW